jgi:hypothetical protein
MWEEETRRAGEENPGWSIYSSFCFTNDRETIEAVTAIARRELEDFQNKHKGSCISVQFSFIHAGGKACRKPDDATAYPWREAVYHAYIGIQWQSKWDSKDMREFCNLFKSKLRPHSLKGEAMFANFPDRNIRADQHERAYYGSNVTKLREVRRLWDGDNFFNWSQGIRLVSLPSEEDSLGEDGVETSDMEHEQWTGYTHPVYEFPFGK